MRSSGGRGRSGVKAEHELPLKLIDQFSPDGNEIRTSELTLDRSMYNSTRLSMDSSMDNSMESSMYNSMDSSMGREGDASTEKVVLVASDLQERVSLLFPPLYSISSIYLQYLFIILFIRFLYIFIDALQVL